MLRVIIGSCLWAIIISVALEGFSIAQDYYGLMLGSRTNWAISIFIMILAPMVASMNSRRVVFGIVWGTSFAITVVLVSISFDFILSNYRGVGVKYESHMYGAIIVFFAVYFGCLLGFSFGRLKRGLLL